ncbi:MAG: PsiF family protein [Gammaproteobacteria bacterium]|nr:PsiF family protein [Gammaproteobacteria bacterium]MDH5226744.1 PsiF family protein [Gammaproteobacteria bacterium]
MNTFRQACASFALAFAISITAASVVLADPPADKGKGNSAQSSGEQHGKSGQQGKGDSDEYRYDDGNKNRYEDKENHGQVVSECNHRANERNLKGQDRKEWTEWCEERGSRHNYDYKRYSSDRNCYQKADNKGLTGDKRRKFINDCLDIPNKR